jgi:hypothetical protein
MSLPSHETFRAASSQAATLAERAELAGHLLRSPPSMWRSETLRALYASALHRNEQALVERLEPVLDPLVGLEERLVLRGEYDPVRALRDDGLCVLTAAGQQRVLGICAERVAGSEDVEALVCALREALDWLSPVSAFVQALQLVRIYGASPRVGNGHLTALASVATPSGQARGDLLRAIGAALSARGEAEMASELAAEAAALSVETREGPRP